MSLAQNNKELEELSKNLPKEIQEKVKLSPNSDQMPNFSNLFNSSPEDLQNQESQEMAQNVLSNAELVQDDSTINKDDVVLWDVIHLRYLKKYDQFFNKQKLKD